MTIRTWPRVHLIATERVISALLAGAKLTLPVYTRSVRPLRVKEMSQVYSRVAFVEFWITNGAWTFACFDWSCSGRD